MEVRGPVMWVFLMCCIFGHIIISHNNDFVVEAKSFSKFEDLEIENRLKTINKPPVKIIKTIDGESYGCVDFFKQPAFDHPSMKNHAYHYKMHPIWKEMIERKTNDTAFGYLWENGVGCPIGTVPIRRVTKDDLLRLNSFDDNHKPRGSWNSTSYDPNSPLHYDKHHYAVARTKNIGRRFNGATMELCVTAPKVKSPQYSAFPTSRSDGKGFHPSRFDCKSSIVQGQPTSNFRLYKCGRSCYNTNCNVGMLLVRKDFPLGAPLLPVSIRGAKTNYYGFFGLIKDRKNGNWWLQFGEKAENIGFWPSHRFYQSFGNLVEWGGEVYSASLPSPEMGYGHFPTADMAYDAYIKRISILDSNYKVDRLVKYLEEFTDNNRGYQLIDEPLSVKYQKAGHIIFYGGPGNI